MIGNFIYIILALFIITTGTKIRYAYFSPLSSMILFHVLLIVLSSLSHYRFTRLTATMAAHPEENHAGRFDGALKKQEFFSIVCLTAVVYGLTLPVITSSFFPLNILPTLNELLYLLVFLGLLCIVWWHAYPAYVKITPRPLNRTAYIRTNLFFSFPALIPWLLLSGISDVIFILPFETPKRIMESPLGEFSYFLVFLFLLAVFAPLLITRFWGCKPLNEGYFKTRIRELCVIAGVNVREILNWPLMGGQIITAGVMGIVGRFRYILVTRALLESLEPEEIDTVIAHEIGHVKHRHLQLYFVFIIGFTIIMVAFIQFIAGAVFILAPFLTRQPAPDMESGIYSVVINTGLIAIFLVYFRYVFGFFIRNFERQADLYVFTMFDRADRLISTFKKIALFSGQAVDKPNWHHFSIKERIDYLLKCADDPRWISHHHRKLKKALMVYVAGILALVLCCVGFWTVLIKTDILLSISENRLLDRIENDPDNAFHYTRLGELYYFQKQFGPAAEMFSRSLERNPRDPEVMNALAWLYATSEDPQFIRPPAALYWAQKAAEANPAPHILDTLAESFFINGMIEDAIRTELEAIEKAAQTPSAREFIPEFNERLEKYRAALESNGPR